MLGHYLKDNFLKPLPKIQDSILIFPSNSNFIAVDSQFSPGIPLEAEEGLELRVLTPPWHTQGFGTAGGRSQIKNLPSGMILWGIRRNMRHGMKSQNCFFFHPLDINRYFPSFQSSLAIRILLESPFPLLMNNFHSSQTKSKWCYRALSYEIRVLFCTSGENSSPLMFLWMLIPMTPLSSRSIFPLLVINSLDSHK